MIVLWSRRVEIELVVESGKILYLPVIYWDIWVFCPTVTHLRIMDIGVPE